MIIVGKRLFGKVDCVPGLFYIATTFLHVFYFPLIPLGSFIVLANSAQKNEYGDTAHMVIKTSFSVKSWLMAYIRGAMIGAIVISLAVVILTLAGALEGMQRYADDGSLWMVTIPIVVVAFILTYLSYKFCNASEKRARALGQIAGYTDEAVLRALGIR